MYEQPVGFMQPTRRRYLSIAGVGIGTGVAGCLSTGSNISYPEPEPEEPDEKKAEQEEEDEQQEDDEPDVEAINERLADDTNEIYEELRWFETEHSETVRRHQSRVREVVTALDSLLADLEEDGEIDADQVADVESFADEVSGEVNEIPEPHFEEHYNYRGFNSKFADVERFREREDWERVQEELEAIKRGYRGASSSSALRERYSANPIDNRLFDWLGGDNKMYELRYISDRRNHHPSEDDDNVPGYGVYILNDSTRGVSYKPIGRAPLRILSSMDDEFEPFEDETDREFRFYARIHDVGDSGDVDPRNTDSFRVYVQRYDSLEAADAAFKNVTADKVIEGEESWASETWKQILYSRDGRRVYAYFIRAGEYTFAVGPSRTPWEERDDDWNQLLEGTWVIPS